MDKLKGALKSKTVWWNLATGAVLFVQYMLSVDPPIVSTETAASVNVVGNLALRFLTGKPLEDK